MPAQTQVTTSQPLSQLTSTSLTRLYAEASHYVVTQTDQSLKARKLKELHQMFLHPIGEYPQISMRDIDTAIKNGYNRVRYKHLDGRITFISKGVIINTEMNLRTRLLSLLPAKVQ
jgi:hypothetical protein